MLKKLCCALGFSCFAMELYAERIQVYAAASLTNALQDIAQAYEKKYPNIQITNVFAASSTLAKQIEAGAESDIYFSADIDWMNYLIQKQKVQKNEVSLMLSNDLVMVAPQNQVTTFQATEKFPFADSFKGYLCTGQIESVPAGKYAKQSLMYLNWFDGLKGRIVGADNVRSALAFVERGECQRGIVYRMDAIMSKSVKIIGAFPELTHDPIDYPLALTRQGQQKVQAQKFYQFIKQDRQATQIFKKYGFRLLNEK